MFYIVPVIAFSIVLSIPKFFETRLLFLDGNDMAEITAPRLIISYEITPLRSDPNYIRYKFKGLSIFNMS